MCDCVKNKKNYKGPGINIGRPSIYGNPFSHLRGGTLAEVQVPTRHDAVMRFAAWTITDKDPVLKRSSEPIQLAILDGDLDNNDNLICWCAPEACHGHVLEEIRTPEKLREAMKNPEEFLKKIEFKIRNLGPQKNLF